MTNTQQQEYKKLFDKKMLKGVPEEWKPDNKQQLSECCEAELIEEGHFCSECKDNVYVEEQQDKSN